MDYREIQLNGFDLHVSEWSETDDHPFVTRVDGHGSAPTRGAGGDRANADGSWSGRRYLSAKPYTLTGGCESPSQIMSEQWRDRLMVAVAGRDLPLTLNYASGPRTAFVRLDGAVKIDRITPAFIEWQLSLIADDPLWYVGDGLTPGFTAAVQRAQEIGGVTFPLSFPLAWDSSVAYGAADFWNPGTGGRLEFRLDGPLTSPMVTTINADGPRVLSWPGLSLAAGEWLDINPARRIAVVQGQASRPPAVRQWPRLTAGANHWQFTAGSGEGTLTVRAWPAY